MKRILPRRLMPRRRRTGNAGHAGGMRPDPVRPTHNSTTIRLARHALLTATVCGLALAAAGQAPPRTFAMPTRLYQVGPNPNAIVAADLTDNGLLDIVTADRGALYDTREERPANDELSILLAEQPFDYVRRHPSLKTGFAPYALAIANVDGLKWPDIIAVNFHATRNRDVSVFLNLKDENVFKALDFKVNEDLLQYHRHHDGEGVPLYTMPGLTDVVIHDVTGNGLRDLIATGWSSDVIVVMPGHRDLIFDAPHLIEAPGAPRALALADLDGDGHMDLAAAMYATAEVALFKGDGKGGFTEATRFASRGRLPTTIHVRDMNRNGKPDIIVSHAHSDDSIVIFYSDGPFSFPMAQELMLGKDRAVLEHEIRDLAIADLNNNGRLDLAAACHASARVVVLFNESETGALPQHFRQEHYPFNDGRPRALCIGDFDKDGRPDIAVALWESNAVGLMRNIR